jgi:hypothetical protein
MRRGFRPAHNLAIPTTPHDSLMVRLDRLTAIKDVAQLGATLGRAFVYELLQAVSAVDEAALQYGLQQLVDAELVYQWGIAPQATYTLKHELIRVARQDHPSELPRSSKCRGKYEGHAGVLTITSSDLLPLHHSSVADQGTFAYPPSCMPWSGGGSIRHAGVCRASFRV